ncbi:MAG: CvpA family protein [Desulfobacterales bacterium]
MNLFDIAIIIIIGFCLIRGFFRGFIKELFSVIGLFVGFYAAYTYYLQIAKLFSRWITDTSYLHILSFMVIFCSIFFIVSIVGVIIKYILNISFLKWADWIFGAGFGAVKGILFVSILLVMLITFLPKGTPIIKKSRLSPHFLSVSAKMASVIPDEMKRNFTEKVLVLKRAGKSRG